MVIVKSIFIKPTTNFPQPTLKNQEIHHLHLPVIFSLIPPIISILLLPLFFVLYSLLFPQLAEGKVQNHINYLSYFKN